MTRPLIDLNELARRENEQTEWKENVADIDDVVATLSAFANDLQNLGGGYVVCGVAETRDEHGFPTLARAGLPASRMREVEGTVMTRCRERVSPPITPLVEQLATEDPQRRILVFVQPATGTAHTFRRRSDGAKHFVRVSHSTIEARNGVLRELLVRKGALEPWDRRPCNGATEADLDLIALRDALQRMGAFSAEQGLQPYLSPDYSLSAFVPPLLAAEPLTGVLRPRNFAMLLFGRNTHRFIPGAVSFFSIYPGTDRSDPHAERHELDGNLFEQARRLQELLDIQSYTAFDKTDPTSPNVIKYPQRALYEAMGNALAHRDYEQTDPTRLTVFSDRIEIASPGPLPSGVDLAALRRGEAPPKWRNQALAWFFSRMQLAQGEGQGIPTILRSMREEGNPPPRFDADDIRVVCTLPAHPRHAALQELRSAEQALALGEIERARVRVEGVLENDPLNFRAIQLFAEIHQARRDPAAVAAWVRRHRDEIGALPPPVLLQLAEAIGGSEHDRPIIVDLLSRAARGRLEERELRRIVVAMSKAKDDESALDLIERQMLEHPEWRSNPSLLQLRGDSNIGLAKRCRDMATKPEVARATKARAWRDFHTYLDLAERDLRAALAHSVDQYLSEQIQRNIDYLEQLRRDNQPPQRRAARRR
ncbi:ATP-binding protein [Actinoplanes flavus]|uniref:DNA binding domain-containing protein n=1 Tax=Actinoplanes flavus TaxID=2820290 RepID=A0ABS3UL34_9ACTN|nr:ATP-binding protein [Actinoplanes flavus]MBO3739493.1 putative DNA binding domain-containing protein [Actinoplanes flavus]